MASPIIFDQFQRYRFIQDIISSAAGQNGNFRILEVGSFGSPLKKLLPHHNIVAMDLDKKDPAVDVIGTGLRLPFSNHAFHIVASTDVLEHMNFEDRSLFIKELARVTSGYLILGFPHAEERNIEADRLVFEFVRDYSGTDFDFLKEHRNFGLPDAEHVRTLVKTLLPEMVEVQMTNVHSWALLQLANFVLMQNPELSKVHDFFTNFFNQSLERFSHAPPNYRTFLVASHGVLSGDVKAEIEKRITVTNSDLVQEFAAQSFALVMAAQDAISKKNEEVEAEKRKASSFSEQTKHQQTEIEELLERIQTQELKIKNLEDYLNLFLQHPAYKVFKFLKKPVAPV